MLGGDIHLFRGWFADGTNTHIKHLYEEVDFLRRAASVQEDRGAGRRSLADPDPLVRFAAVARLDKPDAGQVAALFKALGAEKEWVVQRRIVEALGASGDASAVPALAALVKDPGGLGRFAGTALAHIGAPATPTLLRLAAEQGPAAGWRWPCGRWLAVRRPGGHGHRAFADGKPGGFDPRTRRPRSGAVPLRKARRGSSPSWTISRTRWPARPAPPWAGSRTGRPSRRWWTCTCVQRITPSMRPPACALEAITGLEYGPYAARWKKALDEGTLARSSY